MKKILATIILALLVLAGTATADILGKTRPEVMEALGKPFMDMSQGPVWKSERLYLYVEFEYKGAKKANQVNYEAFTSGDEINEAERKKLMAEHGEFGAADITEDWGYATYYLHLSKNRMYAATYTLSKESGKTRKMSVQSIDRLGDKMKKTLGL